MVAGGGVGGGVGTRAWSLPMGQRRSRAHAQRRQNAISRPGRLIRFNFRGESQ